MADFTDAEHAMIRRLQALPDRPPIVYPNEGNVAPVPRIVVQVAAHAGRTLTLDGVVDGTTEIVAQVEVGEGTGAAAVAAVVKAITDRFKVNTRFDGLVITQPPLPRAPIPGDGYFAVPIIIRARHFF